MIPDEETSPMSAAADRPNESPNAAPASVSPSEAPAASGEPQPLKRDILSLPQGAAPPLAPVGDQQQPPHRRRRRRHRRKGPRPEGAPGQASGHAPSGAAL